MKKIISASTLLLILLPFGCIFKAGNRQKNLDIPLKTNINIFFIREEAINVIDKLHLKVIQNSEDINYPKNFFSLVDTQNNLVYSFEHIVFGNDSLFSKNHSISLHALYDNKINKWITNIDSFNNQYKERFVSYMRLFLKEVVNNNESVNDTILYDYHNKQIVFSVDES